MNGLLDTHTLLWLMDGDARLSSKAQEAFLNQANTFFFSAASYWEICLKISLDKLKLGPSWQKLVEREMHRNAIRWLPLERAHMEGVVNLPWHHRDPFDRILVAQARHEKLTILTMDESIRKYPVRTLW